MDILGAQQPSKGHEACSVYENSHLTPLEDWIQMAIDLEEKQYVILYFYIGLL